MTSSLYLLRDIEFPKDYSAVVDFDNKDLQRLYFQSRRVYGFPTSYNYIRGETQSIRVEIPQIEVQKYSYFEFTNTTPDGKMKTYYAFIDDVRYLDPSTSQIIFTIDVWQTYLFDYEIKDSFIDREHQNRCSSDLKPIFNTEIENIEVGSDYEIISSGGIDNVNARKDGELSMAVHWLEVIATEAIFGDENEQPIRINSTHVYNPNKPSPIMTLPLYVYYIPFTPYPNKLVERGGKINTRTVKMWEEDYLRMTAESNANDVVYYFRCDDFFVRHEILQNGFVDTFEKSMYFTYDGRRVFFEEGNPNFYINVEKSLIDAIMIRDGVNYVDALKTYLEENLIVGVFQLAEPEHEIPMYWMTVGDMYEKCVDNPKVVALRIETYPPFKFRYEFNKSHIGNDEEDILIAELRFLTELDFETTIPIFTDKGVVYNLDLLREDLSKIATLKNNYKYVIDKDIPRRIENETKLRQYPYEFLSITNYRGEMLKLKPEYLSDDEFNIRYKKSISFNHKSKIYVERYLEDRWGNEYGLIDNTVSELPLVTDAYKEYIANSKATATTGVAVNTGMALGGLALGTLLLGAGGPAGSLAFLALGLGVTGAAGVKSELIKQSNLKETPLSERQSGNDLLFDLITGNLGYRLVRKRITPQYYYRLYDYFYRYGYKANRFGVPNLRSRYYFNYIKTIYINIVGDINSEVKEKLKEIYNNGTTIWHCRADNPNPELFMYEKENAEVEL